METKTYYAIKQKNEIAKQLMNQCLKRNVEPRINLIWLEACGCSGNIISLLNAEDPDVIYFLKNMVNMTYNNSLMADEGQQAFEYFMETLETEFILVIEGAIALEADGLYNVIARFNGEVITGMKAAQLAASKAKYILSVGTCASYGGPSSANPNPSESISVYDFLGNNVIRVPGCPAHPDWVIGTIAHLITFGLPYLDTENRPVMFYGVTIHDHCPRRSYFEKGIFASKLGEETCMFKLGCRGPITKTNCPLNRWNNSDNWPIGSNTPCIGCARDGFPDLMEPFIKY